MSVVEAWNRRARWCLLALGAKGEEAPDHLARACLRRWRSLERQCPERELRAAAHQGLRDGRAADVTREHEAGCLTLSSPIGAGKTTAACWRAYRTAGPVLWLNAARVGLARQQQVGAWLDEIPSAALVVIDDVGAPGSTGQWESPKVAALVTAASARSRRSVVTTNLDPQAFGKAYDQGTQGRLIDRLRMRPNRWVDLPHEGQSRREAAEPPPSSLPKRERRAYRFLEARHALEVTAQAHALVDVDQEAIRLVADRLGRETIEALDQAVRDHEESANRVAQAQAELRNRWRLVVPKPDPESDADEAPGAAQVRRCAVLDLLANVAEAQGVTEAEVLERLGRTRRDLGPGDEPALREMLAGVACG